MVKITSVPEGQEIPEEKPKTKASDDLLREINDKLDVLLKRTDSRRARKSKGGEQ